MVVTHVEEEGRNVGNLAGKAVLRLDDEVHLTLDAQEQQRILNAVTPL